MIELEDLSIGYPVKRKKKDIHDTLASNINANLDYGQLICLVGVNGVGKSTLLKTISGFIPPVSGNIWISDESKENRSSITDLREVEKSKLLGVVLTRNEDNELLSVYDVVSLGRTPYTGIWGSLSEHDKVIVDDAIKLVGIESLRDRFINELSDGERQKVMIAKALSQETSAIILDEPSAFLDYPSKEELMRLLVKLAHEEHKAILLSSHDLDIIRRFADGYWIMEKQSGKVVLHTSPDY
jgi:iron complex transport system ATP-binding protein